jgi:hypothetical protein
VPSQVGNCAVGNHNEKMLPILKEEEYCVWLLGKNCEGLSIETSLSQFCISLDPLCVCAVLKLLHPVPFCCIFTIFYLCV